MAWAENRETTRAEDKAYSLLGIFDIQMPLLYGEGKDKAFKRLREEINKALKGKLPSISGVPEIEHFVAKEQELAEMRRTLSSNGSRRMVMLHGLGGIGKTQLAIAYAKRYKDSYSAIFWLNAKDENSLKQSFIKAAKQILREHPSIGRMGDVGTRDPDEVIDAVKAWLSLSNNTRWLLIYDNYDNPKLPKNTDPAALDIYKFLPESYQGSIIITSRSSQVKIGHPIRIRKLENMNDSLDILADTSRRHGLIDDSDAISLAKELDGLPLALATAGAYLEQTSTSFGKYLRLYKDSWTRLQKTTPELGSYEDRTFYSTWQLSFDHIKQRNECLARLLRLWAYFDNQDIWLELLQHGNSLGPAWVHEIAEDELSFNIDDLEWAFHSLGDLYSNQGKLKEAKEMYQRALQGQEKALGPNHISTLRTVNSLGIVYKEQGKLKEAKEMYQRALEGFEKALGPDHTATLVTVNNLGTIYIDQDKLEKAKGMFQRVLESYEKALGPHHTSTLKTINNLGLLYFNQGKLKEAEEMYQRALEGYEKALGPHHTSTLGIVNNLGNVYKEQGKLKEAGRMYQRALEGTERALGPHHKSTLERVGNLGNLYATQGKLKEAEEMYQRALHGFEKAFGPYHTSVLEIIRSLGILYKNQGKLKQAEEMYQPALQIISHVSIPVGIFIYPSLLQSQLAHSSYTTPSLNLLTHRTEQEKTMHEQNMCLIFINPISLSVKCACASLTLALLGIKDTTTLVMASPAIWDYIIIGGGPAGSSRGSTINMLRLKKWNYDNLLPYFRIIEEWFHSLNPEQHGVVGELNENHRNGARQVASMHIHQKVPADVLERQDIEVKLDAPEVGKNFNDHLHCLVNWRLQDPTKVYAIGSANPLPQRQIGFGMPINSVASTPVLREGLNAAVAVDEGVKLAHYLLKNTHAMVESIVIYVPSPPLVHDEMHISTFWMVLKPILKPRSRGTVSIT
ncbi:hypothetical protein DL764_009955 [Monosporascus ibericus]|uniref:Uncharacterized protein n=1 Tax=Monosporascus ibericus TaxID=155417 RepID=A0A4Q4STN4_9PEZI|nr:hypothetical protein DL764_009955 [Monosporascus ibericus]